MSVKGKEAEGFRWVIDFSYRENGCFLKELIPGPWFDTQGEAEADAKANVESTVGEFPCGKLHSIYFEDKNGHRVNSEVKSERNCIK